MASMDDVKITSLEEVGASILDAMEIPRTLTNAKEQALAVLERLYHNERVLRGALSTMERDTR